ncbi:hypothetical protein [Bradyrhizobium guangdongense]|uniref:hypothetical protein n=1 Tax=Bradyrhizobium guangdongense TaxID=1325090 RepID=UPI00164294F3|nr:hypothetical protein [Bradyrhizobium guangdongense]
MRQGLEIGQCIACNEGYRVRSVASLETVAEISGPPGAVAIARSIGHSITPSTLNAAHAGRFVLPSCLQWNPIFGLERAEIVFERPDSPCYSHPRSSAERMIVNVSYRLN